MAKVLRCRHIGPDANCQFAARGETEGEILAQVAEHARTDHGIDEVPQELIDKALAAIVSED
ncbi:MAG: DUF1059 domain-containing protein [Gemmatimonadetes bacterium]|nr:DUF1059 domain-containing protein [Gemmatimonadota bacterium]